jgi:GNAT superfamily N-acetyltransferase
MLDRELTEAWARGWAASRGTTPPTPIAGGMRIDIDTARDVARFVLQPHDWRRAARLGREVTVPGTEIKLVGAADRLRESLPGGWTIVGVHHLMTVAFTHGVAPLPASCTARIVDDGAAKIGMICDSDGAVVSSARLAPSGPYGVIDRVRTRAADQRRGLARAVMTMLGNRALDDGLSMGLLSATADGRGLYKALGWTICGELAGAFRSERRAADRR